MSDEKFREFPCLASVEKFAAFALCCLVNAVIEQIAKFKMKFILLLLISIATSVLGGSVCPPRKDIYPCTCANIHKSKTRVSTIVTCQRIPDTDALNAIFPSLRSMQIDQFYLYDSFWEIADEAQMNLPTDWITLMKIKEITIEDTTLSSCFACQWKLSCKNSHTTKFKVFNSSSHEKICTLCDAGRGVKQPWTGCMNNLTEFSFNHGKLSTLGVDFFPLAMRELRTLNLSHNRIVKIDPNAMRSLPSLVSLDLSHNAVEYIDHIFGGLGRNLEFLDVSWNFIKTIGSDLFTSLPGLKTFKADNNEITELSENDWKKRPEKLINIDLSGNPFHCDCSIKWINSTLPVNVALVATCSTPEDYENSAIRRASRFLTERCDQSGHVGARKKKQRPSRRRP